MWFGKPITSRASIHDEFRLPPYEVTKNAILRFSRCVTGEAPSAGKDGLQKAPMDFVIVAAWPAVTKPLFAEEIDADLLSVSAPF